VSINNIGDDWLWMVKHKDLKLATPPKTYPKLTSTSDLMVAFSLNFTPAFGGVMVNFTPHAYSTT
jgi:hypothetical protein